MGGTYDLIVIGSGPGGHAAAEEAAKLGARVAIVEKGKWGGTCTNVGCIPTKALLMCSKEYSRLTRLKRLGISVGDVSFDFRGMKKHQQMQARVSNLGVQKSLREAGVKLFEGEGVIQEVGNVEVIKDGKSQIFETTHIVIAWGSEPFVLPGITLSERILTSDGILALDQLPQSMAIVGGGVIGVEFATFLAELGVQVTIVELLPQILPYEDEEAAALLCEELGKIGVKIYTSTKMANIEESEDGVLLLLSNEEGEKTVNVGKAAICIGRKSVVYREQLDALGIRYDKSISVDEYQQTNVAGIYALGDVTGGVMLAHRASQQGRVLASRLFGDGSILYNEQFVPSVTYCHPQVARLGLIERQARDQGLQIEIKRAEFGANAMARAELEAVGFVKALFESDRLVGITIVGPDACELIAPMGLAIANTMSKQELKRWILSHPTLSEIFAELIY